MYISNLQYNRMKNKLLLLYLWLIFIGFGCFGVIFTSFMEMPLAIILTGYGILTLLTLYLICIIYRKRKLDLKLSVWYGELFVTIGLFILLTFYSVDIKNSIIGHERAFYWLTWTIFILVLFINLAYVHKQRRKKN